MADGIIETLPPSGIGSGLITGANDPFEFLARNAQKQGINLPGLEQDAIPRPPVNPQEVSNRAAQQPGKTLPIPPVGATLFATDPPPADKPAAEAPPVEAKPQEPQPNPFASEDAAEDPELPTEASRDNFKKLRATAKELKAEKLAHEERLAQVTEELEGYKTGKVQPEQVAKLNDRVNQLEPYEQAFNLRMSPGYQENYVQPMKQIGERINQIAQEYNVPMEYLQEAAAGESEAKLNRFLSDHFDPLAANEVKHLIQQHQHISGEAAEAERAPALALENLTAQYEQKRQYQRNQRIDTFKATAQSAWSEAMELTRSEGKAHELILHPTDSEHNDKFVKPVLEKASTEYASLIKQLAEAGLEQLSPKLAKGLSRMVQLAIASSISIESRSAAEAHAKELQTNSQRSAYYNRPAIGGGAPGSSAPPPPVGVPAKDIGRVALKNAGLTR